MRKTHVTAIAISLLITVAGSYILSIHKLALPPASNAPFGSVSQTSLAPTASAPLGARSKTSGCLANGALPDAACTPGVIIPTAAKDQICVRGYSKTVRNVPTLEKGQVYAEYGITAHTKGQYEVDHLVSLELGGSNDIANLWPEAATPAPGFHEKDALENYLHAQVCAGAISLQQAQQEVGTNWLAAYQTMMQHQ